MFGSSGAHDLGYASGAILIALVRHLLNAGILTEDQVAAVFDDATRTLQPSQHTSSIAGAMRIVNDIRNRVAA